MRKKKVYPKPLSATSATGGPETDHVNSPLTDLQTAAVNSKLPTMDVDITATIAITSKANETCRQFPFDTTQWF